MKKVACITFHAAHNFGSNLQAYALQEFVKHLDDNIEYTIINYRNNKQKFMYSNFFKSWTIKNLLKKIYFFKYKKYIFKRENNFENFINNYLNVSKEFNTLEDLKKQKFDYDYYIAGSDQIWNTNAYDFDWAYFLDYTNSKNKISYAASLGPQKKLFGNEQAAIIKKKLNEFKCISVREHGSLEKIRDLTTKNININVDPTLLLTKDEWEKIIPKERIIKHKYILFYDLTGDKNNIILAKKISEKLNIPIVIPKFMNPKLAMYTKKFIKVYDCGPVEFLNLIKYSNLVLSSSFHGTVFSIILNKVFYSINGTNDNRINYILNITNLRDRNITLDNYNDKLETDTNLDFKNLESLLKVERNKSKEYLINALDIGK